MEPSAVLLRHRWFTADLVAVGFLNPSVTSHNSAAPLDIGLGAI